jgi:hypothetical protein
MGVSVVQRVLWCGCSGSFYTVYLTPQRGVTSAARVAKSPPVVE